MRSRVLTAGLAVVLTVLAVGVVSAQVPFIAVYWDTWYGQEALAPANSCPGFGVPGNLYVALFNSNAPVVGAEFAVEYPVEITWFADANPDPPKLQPLFKIGTTPVGISIAWWPPADGYSGVPLCKIAFWWNCQGCPIGDRPVKVIPHTGTGFLGFVDVYNNKTPAAGLTALFCVMTIPVEETTWGQVKALYGE